MIGRRYIVGPSRLGRLVRWLCNPYRLVLGLLLARMIVEKGL